MEILAFPDEVRSISDAVPPMDVKVDERELQMAHMLIQTMTTSFDPSKFSKKKTARANSDPATIAAQLIRLRTGITSSACTGVSFVMSRLPVG